MRTCTVKVRSHGFSAANLTDFHILSSVNVTVHSSGQNNVPVQINVYDRGSKKCIASHNGLSDLPFQFTVSSPNLWSPDSPYLYDLTVTMGMEVITSYTGFRTVSRGIVDGVTRPLLNGEFVFLFGTLDQGFWPDGIYTPPNREAMVYDLQVLKNLGFNMLRKHVSSIVFVRENCCAEVDFPDRLKSSHHCSIKLVTKWVFSLFKTCLPFGLCRPKLFQTVRQ